MERADVVILGAGGAGLFCAGSLAGRGLRVVVLDHARAPGEKIRISGGGRCNFTNLGTTHETFLSQVPRFCASALAGFRPEDFVALVDRAGIAWHEKTQGQLFCDGRATQIVQMLVDRVGGAELRLGVAVTAVTPGAEGLRVDTPEGPLLAAHVVVATGGKSIPKMGATGIGYDIARATGHRVTDTRPGLVPLTFAEQDLGLSAPLSGIGIEARAALPKAAGRRAIAFQDRLLFTHRGLSGPVILQISSYWQPGEPLALDLAPGHDIAALLKQARAEGGRAQTATLLARQLPDRLAAAIVAELGMTGAPLAAQSDARLEALARRIHDWRIRPVGTEGYRTAEVTVGGVDCRDLDARSLRSRRVPGLYFVGEVVDVTGWLGGYNFQWAWASGHAAAQAILAS
ncbi:MAG TPA: NAD(P)/FAD-dependent oxidoreductase [Paracoccus solventivorans]|mgnify:FL=1|uniref:NAD(P)/FAD-dependent oxidoreductase n=1 Tax=Paracoccus solventivorans TaxID=53463 RepID=UPI002BD0278B|nr:NAD(P)/FAD-dependent oxidoreductase [Paracoccus solventivorans]HMM07490.1 NAD(P)/FAD-dependent oxidoreductase [Paracoccus solventivorans]